jgi:hypothetical protein
MNVSRRYEPARCFDCDYDLRQPTAEGLCPECGLPKATSARRLRRLATVGNPAVLYEVCNAFTIPIACMFGLGFLTVIYVSVADRMDWSERPMEWLMPPVMTCLAGWALWRFGRGVRRLLELPPPRAFGARICRGANGLLSRLLPVLAVALIGTVLTIAAYRWFVPPTIYEEETPLPLILHGARTGVVVLAVIVALSTMTFLAWDMALRFGLYWDKHRLASLVWALVAVCTVAGWPLTLVRTGLESRQIYIGSLPEPMTLVFEVASTLAIVTTLLFLAAVTLSVDAGAKTAKRLRELWVDAPEPPAGTIARRLGTFVGRGKRSITG